MHILHTVLYTFPEVLTRRICQQSIASLVGDHFFYCMNIVFDSGVILWGEFRLILDTHRDERDKICEWNTFPCAIYTTHRVFFSLNWKKLGKSWNYTLSCPRLKSGVIWVWVVQSYRRLLEMISLRKEKENCLYYKSFLPFLEVLYY